MPVLGGGEDCNNSALTNCKNLVTEVKDGSSDSPHLVYVPFYNEASSGPLLETTPIPYYTMVEMLQGICLLMTAKQVLMPTEIL